MGKILNLNESELSQLIKKVLREQSEVALPMDDGGFGFLKSKNQGQEGMETEMGEQAQSVGNPFISFLKQQGFRDWTGGKKYRMNFHYISRKPTTPANLTMVVGQIAKSNPNECNIDILYDEKIERAERYKNLNEYMAKSAIVKIEKLLGKDFDYQKETNDKFKFYISATVSFETAKKVVMLYNQIRLKGPYGGV